MRGLLFIAALFISGQSFSAEYKKGWDHETFYQAVQGCRLAILLPNALDYEKKGLSRNQSKEHLRNELIQITPVFDMISTDTCFCVLNEVAKDKSFNKKLLQADIQNYMNTPRCQNVMQESMKRMQTEANRLRLK